MSIAYLPDAALAFTTSWLPALATAAHQACVIERKLTSFAALQVQLNDGEQQSLPLFSGTLVTHRDVRTSSWKTCRYLERGVWKPQTKMCTIWQAVVSVCIKVEFSEAEAKWQLSTKYGDIGCSVLRAYQPVKRQRLPVSNHKSVQPPIITASHVRCSLPAAASDCGSCESLRMLTSDGMLAPCAGQAHAVSLLCSAQSFSELSEHLRHESLTPNGAQEPSGAEKGGFFLGLQVNTSSVQVYDTNDPSLFVANLTSGSMVLANDNVNEAAMGIVAFVAAGILCMPFTLLKGLEVFEWLGVRMQQPKQLLTSTPGIDQQFVDLKGQDASLELAGQ